MWIGSIAGFLFEIPSGYISDTIGHKKALVFAKICNILSTGFFVLWWLFSGHSFLLFIFGSIFLTLSFSFTSGTISAFMHDTLSSLKREKEFTKVVGKIRGNVSLASIGFILIFPVFTEISIMFPFYIALVIDILWLLISFTLVQAPREKIVAKNSKSIREIIVQSYHLHLLPFAIFAWAIGWIEIWLSPFRSIYLEHLGLPIILMWTVMWLSRLVWFVVWHYAHVIQDSLSFKWFLWLRILVSVWSLFLIVIFQNPYVVGIIFALANWFKWWVWSIMQDYTFKHYLPDPKYKATLSSIKSQVSFSIQIIAWFGTGYLISIASYRLAYFVVGLSLFAILVSSFFFIKIKQK